MEISFKPTAEDVSRYRRLRAVGRQLSNRMVQTIPSQAFTDIGGALGLLYDGALVMDSEDMAGVLADSCLYEWFEDGKNLVQRFAEAHLTELSGDEHYLLNAYLQSVFRVILPVSRLPGAGVAFRDVSSGEQLFIMDETMSYSFEEHPAILATRTMPLGDYWMTGGAGLPIPSTEAIEDAQERAAGERDTFEDPNSIALPLLRACLDRGAGQGLRYAEPSEEPQQRRGPKLIIPGRRKRKK